MIESNVPTGPEDFPLKEYVKTLPIVVILYDIKSERAIREEKIDYGNYEARKWLGKITHYAVTHGYSVETMSQDDYDKEEIKNDK